jgi:hypothetical protein
MEWSTQNHGGALRIGLEKHLVHESIIASLASLFWIHGRHGLPPSSASAWFLMDVRILAKSEVLGVRVAVYEV